MKRLSNQAIVNRLEKELRERKGKPCPGRSLTEIENYLPCGRCHDTGYNTDPKLQAAWKLVTWDAFLGGRKPREVREWPNGAVLGLLEDVVGTLWTWDTLPMAFDSSETGVPCQYVGHRFCWGGDVGGLGKAIMEALNAQAA